MGPWGQKEVYKLDVDNLIDLQYIHLYSLNLGYVSWMGDLNKLAENSQYKNEPNKWFECMLFQDFIDH